MITLRQAVKILVNDMLYRYYGGEFGIIYPKGSSLVAAIYQVDSEMVANLAEQMFDDAIKENKTRLD